ncbi:Glutamyl-tRNA(Gln) amidotransferase subunit C [Rhodococcoides fascians]|uniref:Aspartyl/glutamyl-tRNA(Asn/Gln) amidotransferase subunit C n=2 Tax=root TaxID=1 RepID=A0A143QP73_RHOFA|nr:Glutamyl-tRNA(Gln) amidotransferase subunit C [Rhodococcus fascians]KJV00714.1 glutamyl-tRNA(gln) amidotransferase subunit c gatc [Rhodococcus sp. PML026]NIL83412.1 Aspartyl/glutamyl-tRNA(Asn/Gln) amidotransferase subunit C [Rhodococcus fascians]NIL89937.1 Aspartyl/glutamyl-tRNA(Asn/Gln) amidotransferase subunit C [Rhodococcus fascians]CAH0186326.1 Glutamyl-tRNA(Gln) amidotransferase subunit C [Rhodococcus fascians]
MRTRLDRVRGPVRFALRKYGAGSCRPHSYCVKGVYAVPDISRDEVAHLARLSRLALSDAELDEFAGQLDSILHHVKTVAEVATDDVAPTANPSDIVNVTRPDVIVPGLTPEQSLSGAPNAEEGRFAVPQILGESE